MKKTITVLLVLLTIQMMAQDKLQSTVSVNGEGTVKVVPNQVTIRMSVENSGDDPIALKTLNDKAIDGILQHIKRSDVEAKDVQTQYVNLNKRYDYNTKTYSYQATQTITLLLKDLTKYDALISGLMQRGINRIDGITFGSSKSDDLQSQARRNAVANAKMKAEEYAAVLNQKIGKAIQISEQGSFSPPLPMLRAQAMMMSSDSTGETLAVGEMEIIAKIQVVFELQ